MREHSRNGENVTQLEEALITQAAGKREVHDIWIAIAREIGANAVAKVLDHVGGYKVYAPTRQSFFRALALEVRNAKILALLGEGRSYTEVAHLLEITVNTVKLVARGGSRASALDPRRVRV